MTLLALFRHAPTAWNAEGRVQGRTDVPLSEAGRARLRRWEAPAALVSFTWISSPLMRARETARWLAGHAVPTDPRLAEASWGLWEGRTQAELAADPAYVAQRARGIDFTPPEGESPRMVQARVLPLFAEIAAAGRPVAAVAHRGLIKAVYARATGQDMQEPAAPPVADDCMHMFRLSLSGEPELVEPNVPILRDAPPPGVPE